MHTSGSKTNGLLRFTIYLGAILSIALVIITISYQSHKAAVLVIK